MSTILRRTTLIPATILGILLGAGPSAPETLRPAAQVDVNPGASLSRPALNVNPIAASDDHSLAIASDGTVWAWGVNDCGQLGDGTTTNRLTPVRVSGLRDAIAVAAGSYHSLALASDGTVWAWGDGYRSTPQPMSALTDVVAIAAGDESLALTRDGTVWQWPGYGLRPEPSRVAGMTDVVAIGVGGRTSFSYDHALAVRADGSVWAWGEGRILDWPGVAPARVPQLEGAIAVGAGVYHRVAALRSNGTIWKWGFTFTDLVQRELSDVTTIAVGMDHLLAVKADGTVWGVGCNGCVTVIGATDHGAVYGPVPARVMGLEDVVRTATSRNHSLALKEDGTLWGWGENGSGQLGDGTTTNRLTPAQVKGLPPLLTAPAVNSVVSAASYRPGPIAPGEIVSLFGRQIGPAAGAINVPTAAGLFESTLAQTRVLFDGIAAPVLFAQADQVNALAPYPLAGKSTQVQVEYLGMKSRPLTLDVAESAPGVFSLNSTGAGQGAILNENGGLNSGSNPARRGSIVTLFATGEGQTSPPGVDGKVASAPLPRPLLPVTLQIGGQDAQVLEAASAPGLAGVLEVKARVPEAVAPGPAVPITLVVGGARSQAGVTLAVQ